MSTVTTLIPVSSNPLIQHLTRQRLKLYGAGLLLSASAGAWAQVPFTGTYTQNFDTLATTGTVDWVNDSTLPGWFLYNKALAAVPTYIAGPGSGTAGSFYSFGAAGAAERALGGLASAGGYFGAPATGEVAGWIALAVRNDTNARIDDIRLLFNGEQWRTANASAQTMVLEYGFGPAFADVPEWKAAGDNFNWTSPVTVATAAAVDGNVAGRRDAVGGDLRDIAWAANTVLWLRWVDLNDPGSDHGLAIDDVSLTLAPPDHTPPLLRSSLPVDAATDVALNPVIRLTFDETVKPGTGSFELRQGANVLATLAVTGDPRVRFGGSSITLAPGVRLTAHTAYRLVPTGIAVTDAAGNEWSAVELGFTTGAEPVVTRISAIQGDGEQSPLLGQAVTASGVVTSHVPGLSGFFMQEAAAESDGNEATSEGIFVYYGSANPGIDDSFVGRRVQVSGTVAEYRGQTQLGTITDFLNQGPATLPAPVRLTLPINDPALWERYEGMRVEVASATPGGRLVVGDNRTLGRYGNVTLSADQLPMQFSEVNAPSKQGYAAHVQSLLRNQIVIDDGSSAQNLEVVHGRNGQPLSASNTLRAGDGADSVIGVLDQFTDDTAAPYLTSYRVQPTQTPMFTGAPRPSAADLQQAVGPAQIKIASANVLNFFNVTGATSGSSQVMFTTALGNQQGIRGANSDTELQRQRAKIVANLIGLGADVYGLMEVQNNGFDAASAIQDLANALNASADKPAGAVYQVVKAPFSQAGSASTVPGAGTDAITVAIIYRSDRVVPVGQAAVPDVATYDAFNGAIGGARVPIAQTFSALGSSEQFTLVVNHFKSKGSVLSGGGNADQLDGQGANNPARVRTAQQLKDWLTTQPTGTSSPHTVLVGDFNAYAMEDPITTLEAGGFTKVSQGYSYVFDGLWGSLDHVFVSRSLESSAGRAIKWAINAEEPEVLDYNQEFKTPTQLDSFYAPTAYRSSDHNPIVLGLNFASQAPGFSGLPTVAQSVVVGQAADLDDVMVLAGNSPLLTLTISASQGQVLGLTDADAAQAGLQLKGTAAAINEQLRSAMYLAAQPGEARIELSLNDGVHAPVQASYGLQAVAAAAVDPANRFQVPIGANQPGATGEIVGGGVNCRLAQAPQVISLSAAGAGALPMPGMSAPNGLLDLRTEGCDTGALVTVRLTYPSDLPAGAEFWKWSRTPDNATPHWYRIPATLQGRVVSFVVRDGGLGDNDLVANGRIEDPSALVVPLVPGGVGAMTPVPSLSQWAMALLTLLMGALAVFQRRSPR